MMDRRIINASIDKIIDKCIINTCINKIMDKYISDSSIDNAKVERKVYN